MDETFVPLKGLQSFTDFSHRFTDNNLLLTIMIYAFIIQPDSFEHQINQAMYTHSTYTTDALDYIDSVAVFASIKKTVISKNFQGGSVHSVFGAVDIDLSQSDIHGIVVLDISQAFSEVKLLVPKTWRVEADLSHFCSATEDKRYDRSQTLDSDKVLVITGMSGFAAVNIRSV